MGEDVKAVSAQSLDGAFEENRILEASAAEADPTELQFVAHVAANRGDDSDESAVEAGSDTGLQLAGIDVSDDLPDHGTEVNVDRAGTGEGEVIGSCRDS